MGTKNTPGEHTCVIDAVSVDGEVPRRAARFDPRSCWACLWETVDERKQKTAPLAALDHRPDSPSPTGAKR